MPDEPTLTEATVSFHTNDDDKDNDTHVTVTVRQSDGVIAARTDDDFGHFNDHSDNGPFNLEVVNPSPKSALRSGNVTIRIDPNGDDEWHFNFFANLIFSDGSHLSCEADGLTLDQDRQQQVFGIA
jgi:hypothetical protein